MTRCGFGGQYGRDFGIEPQTVWGAMRGIVHDMTQHAMWRAPVRGLARLAGGVGSLCAVLCVALALTISPLRAQGISLIRDAETERMIKGYADPILLAAGIQPRSVSIYLINDPAINAFVTVGPRMFIHTGLILAADNPNQIIGVIAHETGHIAGAHVARFDDAIRNSTAPTLVTMALGILAVAAGAPDAGLALLLGGQHIAQRRFLSFSRVQEASADQAAVTYLDSLGISSEGLIGFFGKFRDQELLTPGRRDPFVRTHPLSRDRIAALRSRVAESPHTSVGDTPEDVRRLKFVQAKIHGFLDRPEVTFRRYPDTDQSQEARYARTVAHFQRGSVDAAMAEVDPLIADDPENPFFHELRGQALFESGRPSQAIGSYRRAMELLPDEGLFKLMLGQALLASDEEGASETTTREALAHLKEAARQDGENSFVWHQLAIAYSRLGDETMAALATAERFYIAGNAGRAAQFAMRAREKLSPGTPEWNRANDILQVVQDALKRQRNR